MVVLVLPISVSMRKRSTLLRETPPAPGSPGRKIWALPTESVYLVREAGHEHGVEGQLAHVA